MPSRAKVLGSGTAGVTDENSYAKPTTSKFWLMSIPENAPGPPEIGELTKSSKVEKLVTNTSLPPPDASVFLSRTNLSGPPFAICDPLIRTTAREAISVIRMLVPFGDMLEKTVDSSAWHGTTRLARKFRHNSRSHPWLRCGKDKQGCFYASRLIQRLLGRLPTYSTRSRWRSPWEHARISSLPFPLTRIADDISASPSAKWAKAKQLCVALSPDTKMRPGNEDTTRRFRHPNKKTADVCTPAVWNCLEVDRHAACCRFRRQP